MQRHLSVRLGLAIGASLLTASATEAGTARSDHLETRDWTLAHAGPNGLAKCRAFKQMRDHAAELQKADHGDLTAEERRRLDGEVLQAKVMAPGGVTPAKCGVPL